MQWHRGQAPRNSNRGATLGHTQSMTVSFECTTHTSLSKPQLFDRARSIDAHKESMAGSREEAIAGVTSGLISLGEEVTWRAWHFGLPLRMTSRITAMDAPHHFTDEQVTGPFAFFRHVHEFSEVGGTTTMVDRIEFAAPLGPLGRFAEWLFLGRYMQRLIEDRNRHLVGAAGPPAPC